MNKGKMLLISMLITICFVLLASVSLFFADENGFKKVMESKPTNIVNDSKMEVAEEDTQDDYRKQGIELVEEENTLRDIFFVNKEPSIILETGPIQLNIEKVQLELLMPTSEKMKNAVEGLDSATIVRLQVEVQNITDQPVNFDLQTIKVDADTGETSSIDRTFSQSIESSYAAYEKKSGELVILFESKPEDIATIVINFRSPFDNAGKNLGESKNVKVNLF